MNTAMGENTPNQSPQERVSMMDGIDLICWLLSYTKAKVRYLVFIMISCVAVAVITILLPSLIGRTIDAFVDPGRTTRSLTALIILNAIAASLGMYQGLAIPRLTQRISHRLRRIIFVNLLRLPIWKADTHPHGDYMSRLTNDTENIVQTLSQVIPGMISSIVTLLGCLVIMLRISPQITLWNTVIAVATILPCSLLSRFIFGAASHQQKVLGMLNSDMENCLLRRRSILFAGSAVAECRKVSMSGQSFVDATIRLQILASMMEPMMILIGSAAFILTIAIGVRQIGEGLMTVGMLQACMIYARQLLRPFQEGGRTLAQLQGCMASIIRIREICSEEPNAVIKHGSEHDVSMDLPCPMGISFRDIHFSYIRGKKVFSGMSMEIPTGKMTAIIGETGAGKTTLMNLLLRFYQPDSGTILLDGIPIEEWDQKRIYREIAVILQDEVTTAETILEYVTYGIPCMNREEVMKALTMVHADHIIQSLPQGLDTPLTGDTMLSRGQMQMLALARVPLNQARVLILDEATSFVDSCTEQMFREAFEKLRNGRTCIVIAHRLSTIRNADKIVMIEGGKAVEYTMPLSQVFE